MKTKHKPTQAQIDAAKERKSKLMATVKTFAKLTESERQLVTEQGTIQTCEGHPLSLKNTFLAMTQCPRVSMVGGFRQWEKHGRKVSKGSKAIGIFCPTTKKGSKESGEADQLFFRVVNVFDISQTEETKAAD